MKEAHIDNVLVVRTDRIGDVILSLPMISTLHASYPHARISMLLRSYTKELAEGQKGLQEILLYDANGVRKPFVQMLSELRSRRFDTVVISYPTFRLAALTFFAGIPTRVGTGYRWYSFFFNRKVFEHRRTADRHEAQYNLSLLKALGCVDEENPKPSLTISGRERETASAVRRKRDLSETALTVVLHPGSGGSAREWSAENFGSLALSLHAEGMQVVVTGASSELPLVSRVIERSRGKAVPVVGELSLKELAAFLESTDLFVSNSTGPLHIAAAVGTPVIGLYPPIRACSPQRWGPLTEKKVVFVADKECCVRCKGKQCRGNECMDQITVEQVVRAAKALLRQLGVDKEVGIRS